MNGINIIKPIIGTTTQLYAENRTPIYKKLGRKGHAGIDYAARVGTLIIAPCDMEITSAVNSDSAGAMTLRGRSKKSYFENGKEYKIELVFTHLDSFIIKKGEVTMGTPICYSGNSGKYTTGPHLHFGVRLIYRATEQNNWDIVSRNNGYLGYVDPADYWYKTMQKDIRFFKDYKSQTIYQLGIDGFFHVHTDAQLFQRLFGKFNNVKIERLKVPVPASVEKITIASLQKFKRLFKK